MELTRKEFIAYLEDTYSEEVNCEHCGKSIIESHIVSDNSHIENLELVKSTATISCGHCGKKLYEEENKPSQLADVMAVKKIALSN